MQRESNGQRWTFRVPYQQRWGADPNVRRLSYVVRYPSKVLVTWSLSTSLGTGPHHVWWCLNRPAPGATDRADRARGKRGRRGSGERGRPRVKSQRLQHPPRAQTMYER